MRAFLPAVGNAPHQLGLDRVGGLSRRHAGAVADTEDMRVDGDCRMSEGLVQNDIRGLAPDPGSACSASRSSGTTPPCVSIRISDRRWTFFALVLNSPTVRM